MCLGPGIGVEAASCTQSHQQIDRQIAQRQAELNGVVAGVEREDGRSGEHACLVQPGANLLSGYDVDVFPWNDSAHAQGRGPTRTVPRHLHDPGIVPPGHNGLTMGMSRGVVIVAPIGAGFRITPWPHAGVNGKLT